jgi:Ca2+:H+ antiporter
MKHVKSSFADLPALTAAASGAFTVARPPAPIGGGVPGPPMGSGLPAPPQPIDHVGRERKSGPGMMGRMPWWAWVWPLLAWCLLVAKFVGGAGGPVVDAAEVIVLVATVFAAVWHAEVVAHRVGEPFGTLVLALAVTVIEVALIVSVMLAGKPGSEALARDTVFATLMIILNGLVGLCLLLGGVLHREQEFQVKGASAALAVLAALVTLSLVLPNFTTTVAGPAYSPSQLVFAGAVSLVLYGVFIFAQTKRHRDYFLPDPETGVAANEEAHALPPSGAAALASLVLLLISLVAVVGLAKALTPAMDDGIAALGAPKAVVGIVIAAVVLMPESLAALRAARVNRLQTAMNLGLGSALATIGLTIPAVVAVSLVLGTPLTLGLGSKEEVLFALTLLLSVMTLAAGRTTVLQGAVHLVIMAAFLFFAIVP